MYVTVTPANGQFEITESEAVVASGRISILPGPMSNGDAPKGDQNGDHDTGLPLTAEDFYKEMWLRGYEFGPTFRGFLSGNGTGKFYRFGETL